MDNLLDRRGYRSHFLHQIVAAPLNLQNKGFWSVLSLGSVLWKMAKNGQVHEVGKVGRSCVTPAKLFSIDHPSQWYFGKSHFVPSPSICNLRSLVKQMELRIRCDWKLWFSVHSMLREDLNKKSKARELKFLKI